MIRKVIGDDDIAAVAELADEIWHEHFVSIIGEPQVDYMLEKFQSPSAIAAQLESGYEYYIASADGQSAGYTGLIPDPANRRMMISKLYVRLDARGTGLGSGLLEFAGEECRKRGIDTIWLTVNRFNHQPVDWYRRKGFSVVDEVKKDIGAGFFMDDFIMEKKLR